MIRSFPKIFAIGTDYISEIFKHPVEITEKVDGSQFAFGMFNGELFMRSKGAQLFTENPQKMFIQGMDYVQSIAHLLPEGKAFYCEYLRAPKHNTLTYDGIPKNHLALFGVCDASQKFISEYEILEKFAYDLDIDVVPRIFEGEIENPDQLMEMMSHKSYLGGADIEGIVVKNYHNPFLLGGQPMPLMAGKYVSEKFKEVHGKNWKKENTGRGKFDVFKTQFKTEARWEKAIQHLNEQGLLTDSPKDIGALIKEIQEDIKSEESETIKKFLWQEFSGEILRYSVRGFPEWYKERLVTNSFEDNAA